MEARTVFTDFIYIASSEPMRETPFWLWLEKNKPQVFSEALKEYLADRGFNIQLHTLPEKQLDAHNTVFQHFWWHENQKE